MRRNIHSERVFIMKKKLAYVVLLAGCIVLLLTFIPEKKEPGLMQGTYTLSDAQVAWRPSITFDLEHHTFDFTYDPLSSYANIGTIAVDQGKLVATTDDGKFTYTFALADQDSISFVQAQSSATTTAEGATAVADGALFKYGSAR